MAFTYFQMSNEENGTVLLFFLERHPCSFVLAGLALPSAGDVYHPSLGTLTCPAKNQYRIRTDRGDACILHHFIAFL